MQIARIEGNIIEFWRQGEWFSKNDTQPCRFTLKYFWIKKNQDIMKMIVCKQLSLQGK